MGPAAVAAWALSLCTRVRRSQAKALAEPVAAAWCSSNRPRECGALTAGRAMRQRTRVSPPAALAAVLAAAVAVGGKGG